MTMKKKKLFKQTRRKQFSGNKETTKNAVRAAFRSRCYKFSMAPLLIRLINSSGHHKQLMTVNFDCPNTHHRIDRSLKPPTLQLQNHVNHWSVNRRLKIRAHYNI